MSFYESSISNDLDVELDCKVNDNRRLDYIEIDLLVCRPKHLIPFFLIDNSLTNFQSLMLYDMCEKRSADKCEERSTNVLRVFCNIFFLVLMSFAFQS